jgi:hypothetical protein
VTRRRCKIRETRHTHVSKYGSNAFHITMTLFSGGLWLPVWWLCRRKIKTKVRWEWGS